MCDLLELLWGTCLRVQEKKIGALPSGPGIGRAAGRGELPLCVCVLTVYTCVRQRECLCVCAVSMLAGILWYLHVSVLRAGLPTAAPGMAPAGLAGPVRGFGGPTMGSMMPGAPPMGMPPMGMMPPRGMPPMPFPGGMPPRGPM